MPTEVEAQSLAQVDDALAAGADIVLLDNLSTPDIVEAVKRCRGRARTEISGGVTLARMPELAATGADYVSIGALTHSAPAVDLSLEIEGSFSRSHPELSGPATHASRHRCPHVADASERLGIFAGRVRWYDEVGSTNDIVLEWAEAGGEEGLVAVADAQTQRARTAWAHVVVADGRRHLPVGAAASGGRVAPLLTLAAGVAIAEGIEASTGLAVALKWPNDVCVSGPSGRWLKLGGILAEAGTSRRWSATCRHRRRSST